ncbi:hypothetical protein IU459_32880 [Nocardia amamiensis]|uniref:Immunity protein 8 of polymorphic toxin system n=1 Tax=Nocardia amamiensis TaxID=404578 RepID=A0ABS0D0G4_9NOCA|nr:hypothetical protein [Nocardia amamiensis]MBF6302301.1 hypothetical protein [Nocardia amamiensis]
MRYTVIFPMVDENGEDTSESVCFVVNAEALPRVNDYLHFEVDGAALSLVVESVSHCFSAAKNGARAFEFLVGANAEAHSYRQVRRLQDPAQFHRWIAQFPMLEPD